MENFCLRPFVEDDRDWLVARHGALYRSAEGFDATFGSLVGDILDDFIARHDPNRERGWIAEQDGKPLGSIFCVALDDRTAKLRLFLLVPEARGRGFGKYMLGQCMGFAKTCGYEGMELWTHESHKAACGLYRATGWGLKGTRPVRSFGQDLVEQHWCYRF